MFVTYGEGKDGAFFLFGPEALIDQLSPKVIFQSCVKAVFDKWLGRWRQLCRPRVAAKRAGSKARPVRWSCAVPLSRCSGPPFPSNLCMLLPHHRSDSNSQQDYCVPRDANWFRRAGGTYRLHTYINTAHSSVTMQTQLARQPGQALVRERSACS